MKKSTIQIILKVFTLLLIVMTVISFSTIVTAAEIDPSKDLTPTFKDDTSGITTTVGNIMGGIRNAAIIASVIIIMILGVKYILGSPEEKSGYQKSFVPLIVGMVLVVAATSIAAFVFNMIK